eukprot:TRINITY_DN20534_c0_g1_i3.p1 TRINITY_DN20534_c0_g1~~TRINITY_DN20534_c0_g1_i3.p1  ORF type:complete len:689 (-),score=87.53 TRINITY_DN20534_c0_g1_i3:28-2040(-)
MVTFSSDVGPTNERPHGDFFGSEPHTGPIDCDHFQLRTSTEKNRLAASLDKRMDSVIVESRHLDEKCIKTRGFPSFRAISISNGGDSCRGRLERFLASNWFDVAVAVAVVSNSIVVGLEQDFTRANTDTTIVDSMEHFFLFLYVLELGLRYVVLGSTRFFSDNWTRLDIFLATASVVSGWILEPIFVSHGTQHEIGPFALLRTTRLFRVARMVRLLIAFKELWMLVRGLMTSLSTMVYTSILLCCVIYVFSCLSMVLITNNPINMQDPVYRQIVDDHLNDLSRTMLTLVRFATLDSIASIYTPLIVTDWTLSFFFGALFLTLSIVLMNLVTAIIVNCAMEQTMHDTDLQKSVDANKKKKLVKDLREIFMRLDNDGSGHLSRFELTRITQEDREMLSNLMAANDPQEIFDAMDVDGDDQVCIDEFIDAVWQVCVSEAPIEIKRMDKQIALLRQELYENTKSLHNTINVIRQSVGREAQQATCCTATCCTVPQTTGTNAFIGRGTPEKQRRCDNHDFEFKLAETSVAIKSFALEMKAEMESLVNRLFRHAELVQTKVIRNTEGLGAAAHVPPEQVRSEQVFRNSEGLGAAALVPAKPVRSEHDDLSQVVTQVVGLHFDANVSTNGASECGLDHDGACADLATVGKRNSSIGSPGFRLMPQLPGEKTFDGVCL